MTLARMTARAILAGIALMCGSLATAQSFELPEWFDVYKATDGTVIYMQAKGVGAARLGKDIWFKGVHPDGIWQLEREVIDCERHMADSREVITFDRLGNLTYSYDAPDLQHNWSVNAPDSSGAVMEKYACYAPPEKP